MMNSILKRQLKKLGLSHEALPRSIEEWDMLLERISNTYDDFNQDVYLLERSLNISSREMQERWDANKTLEKSLEVERASLHLASKMATLGKMAGGIAHEINNPMAIISLSASQLIAHTTDQKLSDPQIQIIAERIQSTVKRIAKIINGLRAFAREGSKDSFTKEKVQLIIEDTLSLCLERFKINSVQLEFKNDSPEAEILCRPSEISQVILNILNNAYDAIEILPSKWVKVSIITIQNFVEITIEDSGSGIPADITANIFDPFFTTKPVGKGTGLGLSISKGIIDAHNGTFSINSESKHTQFIIRLPQA